MYTKMLCIKSKNGTYKNAAVKHPDFRAYSSPILKAP